MRIKHSCSVNHLKPEILLAYHIACFVYAKHGYECEMTSCTDYVAARHRKTKHQYGYAIDLSIRGIPAEIVRKIFDEIIERLNDQFDLDLKSDHIHTEFDPDNPLL